MEDLCTSRLAFTNPPSTPSCLGQLASDTGGLVELEEHLLTSHLLSEGPGSRM